MINRFMISVAAAALIAGTGFANAQGTGTSREAPSAGSTVQQSAPSEHGNSAAPSNRNAAEPRGPSSGMKATQSEEKSPGAAKNRRTEDQGMQGQKSKSMSSESEGAKGGKDMKAEGREGRPDKTNAETKGGVDSKSQTTTQSQTNQSQTTGQAGAGAKPTTEQRTRITSVIKEQNVQPVTNVNFSISVGTRVPRGEGVTFHPLPAEIVTVYPQWRGYEYILVRDQILVIDPRTGEIVDVIDT